MNLPGRRPLNHKTIPALIFLPRNHLTLNTIAFIRLLAFSLALILWIAAAQSVLAQGPSGIIEGRAVLTSAGSSAPLSDLPVSLFTFIDGVRQLPPAVAQTDAQGRVRITQLSTSANYTYTMFIKFQDTIYKSDVISFAPGSNTAQATVRVYDTTSDDRVLRIDQRHLIVDLGNESLALSVVDVYFISNNGDRTVVGAPDGAANGRRVSFRVPLPADAIIESIEGRQPNVDVFQSSNQLLDTVPIPPGSSSLIIEYRIPYQRSTYALGLSVPYTTTALNLLVAPKIAVRGARLVAQGNVQAGNRQFQHFTVRDLALGSTLAIELSGLPAPLIPMDIAQWLPLATVSLALIAALIIAARRKNGDVTPRRQTPA